MKKFLSLLTVILCLTSCGEIKDPLPDPAVNEITDITTTTTTAPTETTTAAETTTAETEAPVVSDEEISATEIHALDIHENESDKHLEDFLNALCAKDKITLCQLGGAAYEEYEAFDFIDGVNVVGYTIDSSEIMDLDQNGNYQMKYVFTLDISESDHEFFPVGETSYTVTTDYDKFIFGPLTQTGVEDTRVQFFDYLLNNELGDPVMSAYFFTAEMIPIYGRDSADSFKVPTNSDQKAAFYSAFARFISHMPHEMRDISNAEFPDEQRPRTLTEAAKNILGLDMNYTADNDEPLWLGANMPVATVVSHTESDETTEVVLDFYADSLLLTKAFTVKYTLEFPPFKIISIENLYDSGLAVSRYTT
ncbi:MAG: hypothetical protein LBM87_03785 [Ruminococcus sp.]|jgi:hypothetical protein|nr:hypothetical protein [Ruminococcus sp.]